MLVTLGAGLPAQAPPAKVAAKAPSECANLPADLLPVPGGKVVLGTPGDKLAEVTKSFYPRQHAQRLKLLRKLLSEAGTRSVDLEPFYLYRVPVTNEQYLQFVQATGHRFPYHWWKFGKPDQYKETQQKARDAFPKERNPEIFYWEQFYKDLSYAIPPGEEQHPVVFVSWRDAQAFAGWAGMRLPTEAVWVFAATGGVDKQFLWGDEWNDDWLKKLKVFRTQDQRVKPVGVLAELARGPFGHDDMVGNVWEWMAEIGFFPVAGEDAYRREIDKIRKQKFGAEVTEPEWAGGERILKGGSFYSHSDPAEFRIQTRAHYGVAQTVEGAGFRLAKSGLPARDMCSSRLAVEYDASFFGADREPNGADQVGVERYDLSSDGRLILNYHAIALVPVNHMGIDAKATQDRIKQDSRERPLIIGTLVTTEAIAEPELAPSIYTILYRDKGMPADLAEALPVANRELMARARGEKTAEEEPQEGDQGKKRKTDWRAVLARYGITEEEAAEKGAPSKIKHIVLKPGDLRVSTEENALIFRDNQGSHVAAMVTDNDLASGAYRGAEIAVTTKQSQELLRFRFGSPWSAKTKTKFFAFTLPLLLPAPPDVSRPWWLPASAKVEGPGGGGALRSVAPENKAK